MPSIDNIRVVLIGTSHPGNIGATARAMKTMGLSDLRLVSPLHYPCAEATALASGADDLLARAQVHSELHDALAGCTFVIGTTARSRTLEWPRLSPREAGLELVSRAGQAPVALLFGREHSGLSNEEVDCCHALVSIPANPEYSSLNLAAAVQVLSYEIRMAALDGEAGGNAPVGAPESGEVQATFDEVEGLYMHMQQTLIDIGFLDAGNPRHLMRRLRRLFGRAALSRNEVNILRGILTQTDRLRPRGA